MKNYLEFLNEKYRNQLVIPFDGTDPLHDKPIFMHVEDALIDLSKGINQNQYFHSKQNIEEIFEDENNIKDAIELYKEIDEFSDDNLRSVANFVDKYHPNEFPEYWKKPEKFVDIKYGIDIVFDIQISDELTEDGLEQLKNYKKELFEENLDNEGFYNWVYDNSQDDDGLITIYRAIEFNKGKFLDPYENIMSHNGIGVFWTWDADSAESHWGRGGELFILCAKTRPEDVNWIQTIYKNGYDLNIEHEIEMKSGGIAKVIYMKNVDGKKYNLEKPILSKC